VTVCTQRGLKCLCLTDFLLTRTQAAGRKQALQRRALAATTQQTRSAGGKHLRPLWSRFIREHTGRETRAAGDGARVVLMIWGIGGCYGGGEREPAARGVTLAAL